MKRTGAKVAAVLWCAAALLGGVARAQAEDKPLSDKVVNTLMRYAWSITATTKDPSGKIIEIDRNKPKDVIVPVATAREVIRVARLSAHAQTCGLNEEMTANYLTMMRREAATGKWTDQQLLYMTQLHLFTVTVMTGQAKIVEYDEADKPLPPKDLKLDKSAPKCTDAQRKSVQEQIMAYINAPVTPAAKSDKGPAQAPKKK